MNAKKQKPSVRRRLYRWALFALTLGAVGWFVARNAGRLAECEFRPDALPLVLAFCAVLAAYLVRFLAWTRLAAVFGLRAGARRAARAYFLSMLGRYIPGKIGLALVRIEAYGGHPAGRVALATGMELACAVAAAFLLAFAGLAFAPVDLPPVVRWLPLPCIALIAVLLHPALLRRAANAILRLAGRPPLERAPRYRTNLGLALLYTLPGLLHGAGLFLLLRALADVPLSHYPAVTGAYYLASIAGLVAIFAPGGLGVREGILFLVLPAIVGRETAIVAAIAMRLVTVAAEGALAAIAAAAAPRGGASGTPAEQREAGGGRTVPPPE
ncbi:MAG TPA: hypothetical protein ENO23_05140 [Alphaproteobacteria bacterium]|nr:hypothetical protein [Alphaproteobacteria bacterium]